MEGDASNTGGSVFAFIGYGRGSINNNRDGDGGSPIIGRKGREGLSSFLLGVSSIERAKSKPAGI